MLIPCERSRLFTLTCFPSHLSKHRVQRTQRVNTMAATNIVGERRKSWDWPLQKNDEFVEVIEDSEHFEVGLDVKNFTPKEVQVKTMGDLVQVLMEHEAGEGDLSRSIMRCYKLPDGADASTLKSNLDGGILHISAKKKH
ncbi:unnamed protein product [Cylicocyclus nassatus]|uniref:SHSP domain-containing protein n=1 Tax=Cylicocyclus nassatus TaxID=53992 RepID=A0AA36H7I1_CYLNA|nr:unnamed protein product [Cylicocyclus nassatus]